MSKPFSKLCINYLPYLFLFASIIAPAYIFVNRIDVFYFGLDINSAFQFVFSFTLTCFATLIISLSRISLLNKYIIVMCVLFFLTILFYLERALINSSRCIIESPLSKICHINKNDISFSIAGWVLGNLLGLGTGKWIKKLLDQNLPKLIAVITPLAVMVIVLMASSISFSQGISNFTTVLSVIGVIVPVGVSLVLTFRRS